MTENDAEIKRLRATLSQERIIWIEEEAELEAEVERLREHAEKETRKAAAHAEANRALVNEYEARLTAMTEYAEACEKDCNLLREQLDAARQALDPATVAESFHAHYERLAPDYGYRTREESAVPWVSVPLLKKRLMVATVTEALAAARAALGVEGEQEKPQ